MENSSPVIADVQISGNRSVSTGGGISSFSRGIPSMQDVLIEGNVTEGDGGGVYFQNRGTIRDAVIIHNSADESGGGVASNGDLSIFSTLISGNSAAADGGGMAAIGGRPLLFKSEISLNSAEGDGGGFYASNTTPNISFTTMVANTTQRNGGSIFGLDASTITLANSILWENDPEAVYFSGDGDANSLSISFSDVQDGEDGVVGNDNADVNWGDGMLSVDPLFADTEQNDYHLTWENYPEEDETKSPCIDAGSPDDENDPDGTEPNQGAYYFLQASPHIAVTPDFQQFGVVDIGDTAEVQFEITNTGGAPLQISGQLLIPDDGLYFISVGGGEARLDSSEIILTTVAFAPAARRDYQATFRIESNDPDLPEFDILLFGAGATVDLP